jgi:hypothetical protein
MFRLLTNSMSFGTVIISFVTITTKQKKRLLKAKIAVQADSQSVGHIGVLSVAEKAGS